MQTKTVTRKKKATKTSETSLKQLLKKEKRRIILAGPKDKKFPIPENKEMLSTTDTKKPKTDKSSRPSLVKRREYSGDAKWTPFRDFEPEKWQDDIVTIPLQHGGIFTVYPGWLGRKKDRKELVKELKQCGLFRVYQTQSTDQPRAQFLLHKQANEDFEGPNPGYDYHVAKMKAFPLNRVKGVENIWDRALNTCQVDDFRIGANVIYYRGSRDKIHYHADDNQDESVIFAVVAKASRNGRCVSVRLKTKMPTKGDCEYKIFPRSGDAYLMDGVMQQNYTHSVLPKSTSDKEVNDAREARVVVIFRDGSQRTLTTDTGKQILDLNPPPPLKAKPFGNCIEGLEEGRLYTRDALIRNGFHLTQQGVSGSKKRGCEAISLSGDYKGDDDKFDTLVYTASLKSGARAMLVNVPEERPIRVFRKQKGGERVFHRYDGVYRISRHFGEGPITFVLRRNPVGAGRDKNRIEPDELRKLPLYGLDRKKTPRRMQNAASPM